MGQNLNFEALRKNLIDVTKESQMKLGYRKDSVMLYYPLDSLNRLLGSDFHGADMEHALQEFAAFARAELGEIRISRDHDRFCIRIPEEGVDYVHEKVPDTGFLGEFIRTVGCCNLQIEDILQVFYRYSDQVTCEKMDGGEFDYLVYFTNGVPDDFRYCIKFEGHCAIYHRFTPGDYEAFGF